jgi:transposase
VREWLGEQSEAFRKMIKIVVIDPSAPYASGIRAALPDAKIAVDKWHLIALANQMVPRSGNASPATCWATAARSPTRCG